MKITASIKNMNKPAPKWFRKLKRVTSLLSDSAIVILLALGYSDSSLIMLFCRVGISAVMNSLEVILANGEEYVKTESE
jgi:hypothetical protein